MAPRKTSNRQKKQKPARNQVLLDAVELKKKLGARTSIREGWLQIKEDKLRESLKKLDLQYFFHEPHQICFDWVEDVYANAARVATGGIRRKADEIVMVKGIPVDLSKDGIRRALRMKEVTRCGFGKFRGNDADKNYTYKKAIVDADSGIGKFDYVTRSILLHEPRVHYDLIRTNILPTTQSSEINMERVKLINAMMKGDPIDFADFIHRDLWKRIAKIAREAEKGDSKQASPYHFPCLLSDMCEQARVPFEGVFVSGGDFIDDTPEPKIPGAETSRKRKARIASSGRKTGPTLAEVMEEITKRDKENKRRQRLLSLNDQMMGDYQRDLSIARDRAAVARASGLPEEPYPPPPVFHIISSPEQSEDEEEEEEDGDEDSDDE